MRRRLRQLQDWVAVRLIPDAQLVHEALDQLNDAPVKLRLLADLHDLRDDQLLAADRRVAAKGVDRSIQADLHRWADAIERIIG